MKNDKANKYYSQKEIGAALNNAVAATLGSQDLKGLTEERRRKLRNYTAAIVEALCDKDVRSKGLLTVEELTAVLASASLFVHVLLVAKGSLGRLAMYQDI